MGEITIYGRSCPARISAVTTVASPHYYFNIWDLLYKAGEIVYQVDDFCYGRFWRYVCCCRDSAGQTSVG